MTAVELYLVCFIVGLALSVLSFALGVSHLHLHLPRGWGHGHIPAPHVAHGGHIAPHAPHGMAPLNFATLMVFLAWFGGAGALLASHWSLPWYLTLVFSALSGLVGATFVFVFLVKVLLPHDASMRPADYELPGTLATISLPIRPDGTGEITYVQGGARKTLAARTTRGAALAKGVEVVVVRYEQGIAHVRPFDELAGLCSPPEALPEESPGQDSPILR